MSLFTYLSEKYYTKQLCVRVFVYTAQRTHSCVDLHSARTTSEQCVNMQQLRMAACVDNDDLVAKLGSSLRCIEGAQKKRDKWRG